MNLTTVANQGLPDYYGLPNETTMKAIYEAIDMIKNGNGKSASTFEELEQLLAED